jgi:hypothetical protein
MSISQGPALSAIAFQFAAALQAYEADVDRMLAATGDLELYQKVSGRMDEMRLYASSLPQVSVPWVEVLIRHFELTHTLWRIQGRPDAGDELEQVRALHAEAVRTLIRRVVQIVPHH